MDSHQEDTTTPTDINGQSRVQLKHVLIDVDFFEKPKLITLREKFKPQALLWLVHCYMQMSRATNAVVTIEVLQAIARHWEIKNVIELVGYCVKEGLITERDGLFSNVRVERDQERCASERQRARERKAKSRQKYDTGHADVTRDSTVTECVTDGERTENGSVLPDPVPVPVYINKNSLPPASSDNSPEAPRHLTRKTEPLRQVYGFNVWVTESEMRAAFAKWGHEEFRCLCRELDEYSRSKPNMFRAYKDHAAVLRTWRKKYHSDGKVFFVHPELGANFYKKYVVDNYAKSN